jgi:hypothetical protein
MSHRNGEWVEANLRIRRLCPEAYVVYSRQHAYSQRWQAYERMTIPLTLEENLLTQPGMTKEAEAIVCVASTSTELLHKYTLVKSAQRKADADREAGRAVKFDHRTVFRDRVLRGEENQPPPDPPEWKEYKDKMSAHVRESAERTTEQVRATVRNFMALSGVNSRDLTARQRSWLGIGRVGDNWKNR